MNKSFRGVEIPPFWRVIPPWVEATSPSSAQVTVLRINPGRGFGIGNHETTQLCLLGFAHFLRAGFHPRTVLDFGSGSGILAIAAALSGASVHAVEIDDLAIDNARENAALNGVEHLITFHKELPEPAAPFDLVFANILNRVLLTYAEALSARQSRSGRMILSGLFGTDVPGVLSCYRQLLEGMQPSVHEREDWRAIVFSPGN